METPSYVLYSDLKGFGRVSNRDAALVLLSDAPYGGASIRARAMGERTFLSRVVHAEPGRFPRECFDDFASSAHELETAILPRLGGGAAARAAFLEHYSGPAASAMHDAVVRTGGDGSLYLNVLQKVMGSRQVSEGVRGRLCFMLFLVTGCTGSPQQAMDAVSAYARKTLSLGLYTTETSVGPGCQQAAGRREDVRLGLLRMVGREAMLPVHPLSTDPEGTVIGALAQGPHAITDVGYDVSRRHARVFREDGTWWVQGLGSTNGTTLVTGDAHETVVVEPPQAERRPGEDFGPVRLSNSDLLCLGVTTRYLVLRIAAPQGD